MLTKENGGKGSAVRMGYAHAKGKEVIGVVEDKESIKKPFRICVMCFSEIKLVEGVEGLKKELIKRSGRLNS